MGPHLAPVLCRGQKVLVFVDESGHPRPNDPCKRPVLMAVCVAEKDTGRLTRAMYYDLLARFPLTAFGIVMERPERDPLRGGPSLAAQYRWLLERILVESGNSSRRLVRLCGSAEP
jgi:hypothetical protein